MSVAGPMLGAQKAKMIKEEKIDQASLNGQDGQIKECASDDSLGDAY